MSKHSIAHNLFPPLGAHAVSSSQRPGYGVHPYPPHKFEILENTSFGILNECKIDKLKLTAGNNNDLESMLWTRARMNNRKFLTLPKWNDESTIQMLVNDALTDTAVGIFTSHNPIVNPILLNITKSGIKSFTALPCYNKAIMSKLHQECV